MSRTFSSRRLLSWLLIVSVGLSHLYGAWHAVAHAPAWPGAATAVAAVQPHTVATSSPADQPEDSAGKHHTEASHHCTLVHAALAALTPITHANLWVDDAGVTRLDVLEASPPHPSPDAHWAHARAPPHLSSTSA